MIGSYFELLLNTFYHRYTAIVIRIVLFDTFWRSWKVLFLEENIFKVLLYLCFFIIQKPVTSITQKKLVVESCPTTQWTYIVFNFLSIGLQYTLLFKRRDFGLKCLVTITPKVQSLKFKANVWMKQANCRSLFELIEGNSVIIMEQKRKIECSWVCTFWTTYGFGRCRTLSLA